MYFGNIHFSENKFMRTVINCKPSDLEIRGLEVYMKATDDYVGSLLHLSAHKIEEREVLILNSPGKRCIVSLTGQPLR